MSRRRRRAAVRGFLPFFLLVLSFAAVPSDAQTGAVPAPYFGMSSITKSHWPTVSFGAYKPVQVSWSAIETSRGVYKWTLLDSIVALAQSKNIELMYTFVSVPQWASSNPTQHCFSGYTGCAAPVKDLSYWDEFVGQVTTRYKGKIKAYELWNEPNDSNFWTGTVSQMVEMSRRAFNLINAIDAGATVLSPSATWSTTTAWAWLGSFLSAGGGGYFDVLSFHAYTGNAKAESVFTIIDNEKSVMNSYGLSKPMWITEGGWGTNSYVSNADQQAAFLAQRYLLTWSRGVTRFYWYQWDNSTWGTLWDSTNGIHKAGVAYQQVYNWMTGSTMSSRCTQASDYTWTCGFTLADGSPAQAVWNNSTTKTYTAASQFTSYRDLSGGTYTIGSTHQVTIGAKPILLRGSPTPALKAVLSVTPQAGYAPLSILADSSASSGNIASSSVNFGDGTVVSNITTPSHIYSSAGTYSVTLKVTDSTGATSTASQAVNIAACSYTGMATESVRICTPAGGSTVNSPVRVLALAADSNAVKLISVYVDSSNVYGQTWVGKIDTKISMATGTHTIKVQATNVLGHIYSASAVVNVQ